MGACSSCFYWVRSRCNRSGSPYQGHVTNPNQRCEYYTPILKAPAEGEIVKCEKSKMVFLKSTATAIGRANSCPMCFGIASISATCSCCSGKGAVQTANQMSLLSKPYTRK